jgi:hypothetical protein
VDESGNAIVNGGDQVALTTTLGALSAVSDGGDGTYTAVLTSSTTAGTATIQATVNDEAVTQTATVTFQQFGAPQGLVADATSPNSVRVSWQPVEAAASYELFRRSSNGAYQLAAATSATSFDDTNVTGGKAYLYYVRAISDAGAVSGNSAIDVAVTMFFTDYPIIPRRTIVKAVHVTELRTAVNALRATAGLAEASFTDASLAGKRVRPVHVLELRDALASARSALGLPPMVYNGAAPASGTLVLTAHFRDLRNALK